MTQHSTAFEIERPVPAADALKDLPPTTRTPGDKKFNFRKLLMAGAAGAAPAGAGWEGFDHCDGGPSPGSADDAYVETHHTALAPPRSGHPPSVVFPAPAPVPGAPRLA